MNVEKVKELSQNIFNGKFKFRFFLFFVDLGKDLFK